MKKIIDVSRYQKVIDWDAVKASGLVDGVMLKTVSTNRKLSRRADGLYIDPYFERNYAECQRVGLPCKSSKEDIMESTTYDHFAIPGKMVTFCHRFVDVNKIVSNVQKMHIAIIWKRNAGQLPQPFWLGDADGSGACRPAGCAARA